MEGAPSEVTSSSKSAQLEEDFKLLKKFARQCNLRNKLLQRMVGPVASVILPPEVSKLDFENLSEENVAMFIEAFASFMENSDVSNKAQQELEAQYKKRISELEERCLQLEKELKDVVVPEGHNKNCEKNESQMSCEGEGSELAVDALVLPNFAPVIHETSLLKVLAELHLQEEYDASVLASNDTIAPVSSVRLNLNSTVVQDNDRVKEEGSSSLQQGPAADMMKELEITQIVTEENLIRSSDDDQMSSGSGVLMRPNENGLTMVEAVGDVLITHSIQEQAAPIATIAIDDADTNPFEVSDDEFDQFVSEYDRTEPPPDCNIITAAVTTQVVVTADLTVGDGDIHSNNSEHVETTDDNLLKMASEPEDLEESREKPAASNPFDSSDDELEEADKNIASSCNATDYKPSTEKLHTTNTADVDEDASDIEESSRSDGASTPFGVEWKEYTERHVCPPYGLNSPVIDHLLLSWTPDQRKIHYLISWIECLASPLPKQFPPGLQIVRVTSVVRDGFLILLLPLIRDISMHEVHAFAKLSAMSVTDGKVQTAVGQNDDDTDLYDVRFEVRRSAEAPERLLEESGQDISVNKSISHSELKLPSPAIEQIKSQIVDSKYEDVKTQTSAPDTSGVWHSSLTSLLSPIVSLWPLKGSEGKASEVTIQSQPRTTEVATIVEKKVDLDSTINITEDIKRYTDLAAAAAMKNNSESPAPAAAGMTDASTTVKKANKGPPSEKIKERLAALRNR